MPTGHGPRTTMAGSVVDAGDGRDGRLDLGQRLLRQVAPRVVGRLEALGEAGRGRGRRSASSSAAASVASPIRPAALIRGASDERDGLEVDAGRGHPGPGEERRQPRPRRPARIRSRPSRAMARFSPTIGATSETVPMIARSARSRAASGAAGHLGQDELGDLERDAAAGQPAVRIRARRPGAG